MKRAIDLAQRGMERVSPNPMVGCVIVCNDKIIGEGYHQEFGKAHAEVNAINSVKDKTLLANASLYVSLEPCSHFGKTPPCADLIIKNNIKSVFVCNLDPNPVVSGKGIEKLKDAGILVESGHLAKEGMHLNRRFFKAMTEKLPYIIIKWAETADGFVAKHNGSPFNISNEISNVLVHKWRSEEDAIMVGTHTLINDNPQLNNRNWPEGKNPIRIIIDNKLNLNNDLKVLDALQKTIVLNEIKNSEEGNLIYIKIEGDFLIESFKKINQMGINSILIEGGPTLIQSCFEANLYDEIRVIKNIQFLETGIKTNVLPVGLEMIFQKDILMDRHTWYRKKEYI